MRPTEGRPASVRPHLEPLSAPGVEPAERAEAEEVEGGLEEEHKVEEVPEQEEKEEARSKARVAPE